MSLIERYKDRTLGRAHIEEYLGDKRWRCTCVEPGCGQEFEATSDAIARGVAARKGCGGHGRKVVRPPGPAPRQVIPLPVNGGDR